MSGVLAVLLGISLGITLVGLVQWRRSRRARHLRDQIEDALKHLSEEEYRGRRASLSSLGGALRRARDGDASAVTFIDLGPPIPGVQLRFVDGEGCLLPDGVIGRVQF